MGLFTKRGAKRTPLRDGEKKLGGCIFSHRVYGAIFFFCPLGTHENVYDIFTIHKYKSIFVSTAKKFQLKHILCARPCAYNASSLPKALLAQYYGEVLFFLNCF